MSDIQTASADLEDLALSNWLFWTIVGAAGMAINLVFCVFLVEYLELVQVMGETRLSVYGGCILFGMSVAALLSYRRFADARGWNDRLREDFWTSDVEVVRFEIDDYFRFYDYFGGRPYLVVRTTDGAVMVLYDRDGALRPTPPIAPGPGRMAEIHRLPRSRYQLSFAFSGLPLPAKPTYVGRDVSRYRNGEVLNVAWDDVLTRFAPGRLELRTAAGRDERAPLS